MSYLLHSGRKGQRWGMHIFGKEEYNWSSNGSVNSYKIHDSKNGSTQSSYSSSSSKGKLHRVTDNTNLNIRRKRIEKLLDRDIDADFVRTSVRQHQDALKYARNLVSGGNEYADSLQRIKLNSVRSDYRLVTNRYGSKANTIQIELRNYGETKVLKFEGVYDMGLDDFHTYKTDVLKRKRPKSKSSR